MNDNNIENTLYSIKIIYSEKVEVMIQSWVWYRINSDMYFNPSLHVTSVVVHHKGGMPIPSYIGVLVPIFVLILYYSKFTNIENKNYIK